jgi:hypothetical protein
MINPFSEPAYLEMGGGGDYKIFYLCSIVFSNIKAIHFNF